MSAVRTFATFYCCLHFEFFFFIVRPFHTLASENACNSYDGCITLWIDTMNVERMQNTMLNWRLFSLHFLWHWNFEFKFLPDLQHACVRLYVCDNVCLHSVNVLNPSTHMFFFYQFRTYFSNVPHLFQCILTSFPVFVCVCVFVLKKKVLSK